MTISSAQIRPAIKEDIPLLARLISTAYHDVALRFNLTSENCPKHPSNCTPDWVANDIDRGVNYFVLEVDDTPVGCVAIELPNERECYLERLAVLPSVRRRGYGAKLVQRILDEAQLHGVKQVGIGIIGAQLDLKQWYRQRGFREGETKTFEHLPFEVTFMHYRFSKDG